MNRQIAPLEETASQWFVNRKELLDYFWTWANGVPHPGRHSTAFAGLRRTGKTAIIHRVFNRLFYEQERVLPVFITFEPYLYRRDPLSTYEFAQEFFDGYLRSYLAFRYQRADFHRRKIDFDESIRFAEEVKDELALEMIDAYNVTVNGSSHLRSTRLSYKVIAMPMAYGAIHDMPTAVFIDEFQLLVDCYDPDDGFTKDLTNAFQKAVETVWAPVIVSGSSVNLLLGQATGGALSGRLRRRILGPLEEKHAIDMILRLGAFEGIDITEEFALAIWDLTQGYPYAIESLLQTHSPAKERYPDPAALDEVLHYELTNPNGSLNEHYNREFNKYSTLLNEGETTKKVMFWATKYRGEQIDVESVAQEIGVDRGAVQESLQKLEQIDIVRNTVGSLYDGPIDPMLIRYIEFRHQREIEELSITQVAENLQQQIRRDRGAENHAVGKMAEIIVGAVMRDFDGRTLDGDMYFSALKSVTLPKFAQILHRWGVMEEDVLKELDLIGEYPLETQVQPEEDEDLFDEEDEEKTQEPQTAAWLVQVKYRKRTTSEADVEAFLAQIDAVQAAKGYTQVTPWYVSRSGYTQGAEELLRTSSIYFSTIEQFNILAREFDFWGLPK